MSTKPDIQEQISLFRSLFKGREDVFAIRWEKGNKSGYMPAYFYDPYRYRVHRINGGTFKNFTEKSYLLFTDEQVLKHLTGEHFAGVYPLLPDNTSWFIAADFDKENWEKECKDFIDTCKSNNIPAYLERSRSGNGGHIWVFFEQAYPAVKSRTLFKHLLEESGAFSIFDNSSSFDRLFPNQDYLSGKGLGNLIALPLHEPNVAMGNSCFIDPETFIPYKDQWEFLKQIQRIKTIDLDLLHSSILQNDTVDNNEEFASVTKLAISLDNTIRLTRTGMPLSLVNFIKSNFNIPNPEYFIKKKMGKNVWNTDRTFNLISESEHTIILPRGAIGRLIRFCKAKKMDFDFHDKRVKSENVHFTFGAELYKHQRAVMPTISKKDFGVIVAPPGSGKTIIGLKIIADKQQPALIVVHRKQLFQQWMERIESFLKIPKNEIGKIGQGKTKIGKQITVAMVQSLAKKVELLEIEKHFKAIIIDECHHIPAQTYAATISKLSPYYQYGLTATPFRKNSDGKLIFAHLGELIAEIKPQQIETYEKARVVVRNTDLDVPFNSQTDAFETLSKVLVHDSARNKSIVADIGTEIANGKRIVVITERKEHITILHQLLKQNFEVITLSGDDSERDRDLKWKLLKNDNYQVLVTTGQFFGEGSDIQNATCLFLVYPFAFKGKLIQYIGRVQRSEIAPLIYDYRDYKIDYLNRLFLKRNTYYRNFYRQETLFDAVGLETTKTKGNIKVNKNIKVAIEKLDFRFGIIAFNYKETKLPKELEFEIENEYIRPEFEVLKPYFAKLLGSKSVEVNISAEFELDELVAQLAISPDLENMNRGIIESVRFKFVEKSFFGKKMTIENEPNDTEEDIVASLYTSEKDMLDDILKNKNVKHFAQLRYLAANHCDTVLKLRFILNPFSFVFLLSGKHQYHLVLETLDTEEATYIWHIDKGVPVLMDFSDSIESALNTIRNEGRLVYLESQPGNFSRIIHDYTNDRKGFVQWRDMLEEKLY